MSVVKVQPYSQQEPLWLDVGFTAIIVMEATGASITTG